MLARSVQDFDSAASVLKCEKPASELMGSRLEKRELLTVIMLVIASPIILLLGIILIVGIVLSPIWIPIVLLVWAFSD